MTTTHTHKFPCKLCGKSFRLSELLPGDMLHGAMHDKICAKYPEWTADCYICLDDLNRVRHEFIQENLTQESGELSALQQEVVNSLKENESILKNLNTEFANNLSFGERLADKVAEFGGSWKFIILFMAILFIWIVINSVKIFLKHPFDEYPYILLNLVLLRGGHPGASDHDEPEPPGIQGSPALRAGFQNQFEG